ncbi:hypothetical protein GOP47_0008759 [Adiantum capillus-veneris]|uniref:Uncharacterized protein n=1 Tax=Adiantum capillus-veneris TaxID=13818 RepID=A0A9D4UZ96_ADICA|nr:hypothetical protein GOP47_0008759 [Adiantum capillus-veneris]
MCKVKIPNISKCLALEIAYIEPGGEFTILDLNLLSMRLVSQESNMIIFFTKTNAKKISCLLALDKNNTELSDGFQLLQDTAMDDIPPCKMDVAPIVVEENHGMATIV